MIQPENRRHGPKPRETVSVSFRLPSQLKSDLEYLARRDDRSLANFIEHLLKIKAAELKKADPGSPR